MVMFKRAERKEGPSLKILISYFNHRLAISRESNDKKFVGV
jgi:hypothetical protein